MKRRSAVAGVPFDAVSVDQARSFAVGAVEEGGFHSVLFSNAAKVVSAERDERLRLALAGADLVGVDGQSLVWAGRLLGHSVPERVAGIDFMLDLLSVAGDRGWRVFLLGATDEVLDRVEGFCRERHPALVVAGRRNGYFSREQDAEVAEAVRAARADVLFVGMPSPLKELWIADQGPRTGVALAVGSGGSFDVVAGVVKRAPKPVQRVGLEWLWRVFQEPRRLWKRYLTTNSRFIAVVLRERFRP